MIQTYIRSLKEILPSPNVNCNQPLRFPDVIHYTLSGGWDSLVDQSLIPHVASNIQYCCYLVKQGIDR